MSQGSWNRKEVGGLLLAGASIISAFQTALFGKWVDAKLVEKERIANAIGLVGFVSIIGLGIIWTVARVYMNKNLPRTDKLNWKISSMILLGFLTMCIGWLLSII